MGIVTVVQMRIDMPSDLHRQLKVRAIEEGKTLTKLLREFIDAGAAKPSEAQPAKR